MAGRKRSTHEFEVALSGEGVSLGTVSVDRVIAVLDAAQDLVRAVAAEKGVKAIPCLTAVRSASAHFRLGSAQLGWAQVASDVETAIATRGENASPAVRAQLSLLSKSGGRGVAVKLVKMRRGKPLRKEIPVLDPEPAPDKMLFSSTIYGRIVGVRERTEGTLDLRIDRDDGDRVWMKAATEAVFSKAVGLIRKAVVLRTEGAWTPATNSDGDWTVLSVDAFKERDLTEVMAEVRKDLRTAGLEPDVDTALRDLGD